MCEKVSAIGRIEQQPSIHKGQQYCRAISTSGRAIGYYLSGDRVASQIAVGQHYELELVRGRIVKARQLR